MALTKLKDSPFWYTELPNKYGKRERLPTEFRIDGGEKARAAAQRVHNDRKITTSAAKIEHRANGSPKQQKTMTLNEGTDLFFEKNEDLESPDPALRQRAKEVQAALARLCIGLGKSKKLHEITLTNVVDYVDERKKVETRRGTIIAPATVNKDVELLRRVMRYLGFKQGVVLGAPIEWGEAVLKTNNKRIRFLSLDEEKRLFENLRWDFHAMVKCALMTSMRASNVALLKWEHVDFENDQLHVVQKGRRDFSQAMSPALRSLLLAEKGRNDEFVFTYVVKRNRRHVKQGTRVPFTKTGWSEDWRNALTAAKIKNFKFHDTRHTGATRLAAKTKHLPTVMAYLGHADIQSTMRYAHLCDGAVRDAVTAMHAEYYPAKARVALATGERATKIKKIG